MKFLILIILAISANSYSSVNENISKCVYKTSSDALIFKSYLDLIDIHSKRLTPYDGKPGVRVKSYDLSIRVFAFLINTDLEADKTDILIFNLKNSLPFAKDYVQCNTEKFGLQVIENISLESISTQGPNGNLISNFSYIIGSEIEYKPHSNYLDKSNPIRKWLGREYLSLISPSEELTKFFFKELGLSDEQYRNYFPDSNAFKEFVISMPLHEIHHVLGHNDNVSRFMDNKNKTQGVLAELKQPSSTRSLLKEYIHVVQKISYNIELNKNLKSLKSNIEKIKKSSPYLFKMINNYERIEGLAEYVASYSLIQLKIRNYNENLDYQWNKDQANTFFYKTGALAALVLKEFFSFTDWQDLKNKDKSLWENVIRVYEIKKNTDLIVPFIDKSAYIYKIQNKNIETMIDSFISYFEDQPWYQDSY